MLKGEGTFSKSTAWGYKTDSLQCFMFINTYMNSTKNQSSKMHSPNWCVIDNMAVYSPFSTYVVAWKHNVWLDVASSLTLNPLPLYVPYIRFRERYFKWKRNILLPLILAGFCCEVNTKLCFHSNLVTLYMGERKEQQLPRIQTLHLESCQRDGVL